MTKVILSVVTGLFVFGSLSAFADDTHRVHRNYQRGGEHHQTWNNGGHRGGYNRYQGDWSRGDSGNNALLGLAAGAILGDALGSGTGNPYYSYEAPSYAPYGYQSQCYYYPGTTQVYCPQSSYTPYGY